MCTYLWEFMICYVMVGLAAPESRTWGGYAMLLRVSVVSGLPSPLELPVQPRVSSQLAPVGTRVAREEQTTMTRPVRVVNWLMHTVTRRYPEGSVVLQDPLSPALQSCCRRHALKTQESRVYGRRHPIPSKPFKQQC